MADLPWDLPIDTSVDGIEWTRGWRGNALGQAIVAAMHGPRSLRVVLPLTPRDARRIRLRHTDHDRHWSIGELEVRSH